MSYQDYTKRPQNAALMIATEDDDGRLCISAIPLAMDADIFASITTLGICSNNEIIEMTYEEPVEDYWTKVWDSLRGDDNGTEV